MRRTATLIELYWETERFVPEPPPPGLPPLARDRLGRRGGAGVDVRRLDHVSLLAADVAAGGVVRVGGARVLAL